MNKRYIYCGAIFCFLIGLLLFSGCIGQVEKEEIPTTTKDPTVTEAPIVTTLPPEKKPDAKALFEEKCSFCHSVDRARSLRKSKSEWRATVNRMQDINDARTVAGLRDEDAEIIVDYLAANYGGEKVSLPATTTPPIIFTASMAAEGRDIFLGACSGCHGSDAAGGSRKKILEGGNPPADFTNRQYMEAKGNDVLIEGISIGIAESYMPEWILEEGGPFDNEQIKKLVAYLRSVSGQIDYDDYIRPVSEPEQLFNYKCAFSCHSTKRKEAAKRSPEGWRNIVDRMIVQNGAPIKEEEAEKIIQYLIDTSSGEFSGTPLTESGLPDYYALSANLEPNLKKSVERGRLLWQDPRLGTNGRTCIRCHPRPLILKTWSHTYPKAGKYYEAQFEFPGMSTISDINNILCVRDALAGEALDYDDQRLTDFEAFETLFSNGKTIKLGSSIHETHGKERHDADFLAQTKATYQDALEKGEALFNDPTLGTNGKSCNTCHPNGGSTDSGIPELYGMGATYPKYREDYYDGARVVRLEQYINSEIVKKLEGEPLKGEGSTVADDDLRFLLTYVKSLSEGYIVNIGADHAVK